MSEEQWVLTPCAKALFEVRETLERVRIERNKATTALQAIIDAGSPATAKHIAAAALEEIGQ